LSEFRSIFWELLEKDLNDPEAARIFFKDGLHITFVDDLINQLDDKRAELGINKTQLAKALGVEPANVRRLFSKGPKNPTLTTMIDLAFGLGLKLQLVPLTDEDLTAVIPPRVQAKSGKPHAIEGPLDKSSQE
jgi:transcriptional regulator with XRE-family HTH domain